MRTCIICHLVARDDRESAAWGAIIAGAQIPFADILTECCDEHRRGASAAIIRSAESLLRASNASVVPAVPS